MKASPDPVPAPEPLPAPVIDNHTHLDEAVRPAELIAAAVAVNVSRMVQIGCDLSSARWTVQAVEQYPELLGGVALHPTEATKHAENGDFEQAFAEIEKLAAHPRIRVVGETGLDHYWVEDDAGRAAQEESFRRHIDLAKRLGKVLQIHDRDAHDDVLRVLREEGAPDVTVFHCFSGDAVMAEFCVTQGWYLSFAGPVTFKNAGALREALLVVPADRVLVETDAPYLTPHPHRGKPNGSYLMPHTVRQIAAVTGRDLEAVCVELADNAQRIYGSW
jgi:TatD DNase family protein